MKILHLDNNHPLLINQLEAKGYANHEDYTSSKQEIEKIINQYQGIVIRSRFNIDKVFLDAATHLKFIARIGAGLESIDLDYAAQKDIQLFSAPEGNKNAVGEHAIGMLLSLFNNLNNADVQVKKGLWNREANRGIELEGKTVGIIGYGNMGKSFAKKLSGFNCKVICYDIKTSVGDTYAKQVSLTEFKNTVDVISLHTPWTPLTHKMINAQFIKGIKKPFWFINTARGDSVITKDLVNGLQTKKILGAGLDVLEFEKKSFESLFSENNTPKELTALLKFDNVLLTPHIAGWTLESKEKLAQTIVDKIVKQFKK